MPLLNDIMDNKVLGREYKKGLSEGVQQGVQQGLRQGAQQGVRQGELNVLRRLIEARFGPMPAWVAENLAQRPVDELEDLSVRVLVAQSLEELLG